MARSRSQRARDKGEYRRNKKLLLRDEPRECMLCHGTYGPILYRDDIGGDRWYLHPRAATADHIVPVIEGGGHALSNLRPAHRSCNSRRNRSLRMHEVPRRFRDFGSSTRGLYGAPGKPAPRSF
jgi:5-methylcytosine-specific restriction endonuclease McrA